MTTSRPPIGQSAGARAGCAGIGLRTGAVKARQQRRSCDTRLRVGLDEARDGRRDVQIDVLGLLHQTGQFGRTEAAPPVQRREARPDRSVARPCIRRECPGPDRAGPWSECSPQNWRQCRAPQAISPRDPGERWWQAGVNGNTRESLSHVNPPPGMRCPACDAARTARTIGG